MLKPHSLNHASPWHHESWPETSVLAVKQGARELGHHTPSPSSLAPASFPTNNLKENSSLLTPPTLEPPPPEPRAINFLPVYLQKFLLVLFSSYSYYTQSRCLALLRAVADRRHSKDGLPSSMAVDGCPEGPGLLPLHFVFNHSMAMFRAW